MEQLYAPFFLSPLPWQGEGLASVPSPLFLDSESHGWDLNGLGLRILLERKDICPGPVIGSVLRLLFLNPTFKVLSVLQLMFILRKNVHMWTTMTMCMCCMYTVPSFKKKLTILICFGRYNIGLNILGQCIPKHPTTIASTSTILPVDSSNSYSGSS